MLRLVNPVRTYAWGSPTAIPELIGTEPDGRPVAELWLGAHHSAPSLVVTEHGERPLDEVIAGDPDGALGGDVVARFGTTLPYLLKIIAAASPLSLQVHPHLDQAREGFDAEEEAGVPVSASSRNYKDRNHKPELIYALTTFEALCGFRAPRRAAELLAGLDAPLAVTLAEVLHAEPTYRGIRTAFRRLLDPDLRPSPEEIAEVVVASARRLEEGSPSPRADRIVARLAEHYPDDPGVVVSLLLNPVTLQPGEAMFVPAGGVHSYLHGLGLEVMANSDNVLRAGLTGKHIDVPGLLAAVDYVAAPPVRIAPESRSAVSRVFYAPVDDFELSVTQVADGAVHEIPGRGPRVLLCLDGALTLTDARGSALTLTRGRSAFAAASDGALSVRGSGTLVQADVP